jgi:hypothetical protein
LLNTDPGVRGVHFVSNDLCFLRAEQLRLEEWSSSSSADLSGARTIAETAIDESLASLISYPVHRFVKAIADGLATFDWRTSAAPGLTDSEKTAKQAIRGSGGYREMRRLLLRHLAGQTGDVAEAAAEAIQVLGY